MNDVEETPTSVDAAKSGRGRRRERMRTVRLNIPKCNTELNGGVVYFSNSHAIFFSTRSTRSMSCKMSFFACAAEKNAASSCDGGKYTPSPSIRWKNRANFSRFEVFAELKSNTGPSVKNRVHIEPTRLRVTATPCFAAADVTPQANSALRSSRSA